MAIPLSQARNLFTDKIIAVFDDRKPAPTFLRGLFKNTQSPTKYISTEVRRNSEWIATDIARGASANIGQREKSSVKTYLPPLFGQEVVISDLELYDRVIGAQDYSNASVVGALVNSINDELDNQKDGIERAKEKLAADALVTGIVTLSNGDSIDFKRKSGSLVDASSHTWATQTNDPLDDIAAGCAFIRKTGKSGAFSFDVIMGASAVAAFLSNEKFQKKQDILRFNNGLVSRGTPTGGAVPLGTINAGAYEVNLWTYPQYYDVNGTSTPYIDDKKIVIVPVGVNFHFAHAQVPQLLGANGEIPVAKEYSIFEKRDEYNGVHRMKVCSAGVPILTAVDQVYTAKVLV